MRIMCLSNCVKAIENSMMNNGYLYIINSAPGIGKSTLLQNLHMGLPEGFAILDGDEVGRVINVEQAKTLSRQMKNLSADYRIDTTEIMPDQVLTLVLECITGNKEIL